MKTYKISKLSFVNLSQEVYTFVSLEIYILVTNHKYSENTFFFKTN